MSKFVSALFLSLMPFLAYAADVHEPVAPPDTNPWALIVFTLLFVGMIVAFFVYMWMKQRDKKQEGDPS
jgi:cytochrome bd-type quinol oxidase subunit 2